MFLLLVTAKQRMPSPSKTEVVGSETDAVGSTVKSRYVILAL
jgi:hypothetical protein